MCPALVPNYLHLLNAPAKSWKLNYSTLSAHLRFLLLCLFISEMQRAGRCCLCSCVNEPLTIWVCVVERLCHRNVSIRALFALCVCPISHATNFQEYRHLLCISRFIQVPGTKYNFLNSFGYAARTKCSKQMLRIVMITVLHKEKSAHKRNSSTRESNKM